MLRDSIIFVDIWGLRIFAKNYWDVMEILSYPGFQYLEAYLLGLSFATSKPVSTISKPSPYWYVGVVLWSYILL